MNFEKLEQALLQNSEITEKALDKFFDGKSGDASLEIIMQAQKYSLLGGGKRIRPFLTNEVCRMLGGKTEASMPFAIAVEMIHTYSLIHDDLPCMDDDDMRRGKPSCHKAFGEDIALLAGDTLLTTAFSVAANAPVDDAKKVKAISILAKRAGAHGMIGGQVMDLDFEVNKPDIKSLYVMYILPQ